MGGKKLPPVGWKCSTRQPRDSEGASIKVTAVCQQSKGQEDSTGEGAGGQGGGRIQTTPTPPAPDLSSPTTPKPSTS